MTFPDRGRPEWLQAVQEERRAAVARFNDRRRIEWRLALTLWGGFGLAANALRDSPLEDPAKWIASAVALLVVSMHLFWVRYFMVRANIPNWHEGRSLTRIIREETLGITQTDMAVEAGEDHVDQPRPWYRWAFIWFLAPEDADDDNPRPGWGSYWQVGITLLLAAYVWLIVWGSAPAEALQGATQGA
ncbi:MAG: hypothetical protein PVG83_01230 [Acidimicrobiia bacterium]